MDKTMPLKPRVSEKSYGLSRERNTYVFVVPKNANKLTVADAVAAQFGVIVESVNMSLTKGKVKRSYRKRSRAVTGHDNDVKKAYVRLKAGDSIPVFDVLEDSEDKADDKAKKKEKK